MVPLFSFQCRTDGHCRDDTPLFDTKADANRTAQCHGRSEVQGYDVKVTTVDIMALLSMDSAYSWHWRAAGAVFVDRLARLLTECSGDRWSGPADQ